MARGDELQDEEELVRALYFPLWDEVRRRATTAAFCQTEVSVSRTRVLPYSEIVQIFKDDLNDKDLGNGRTRSVVATATLRDIRRHCDDVPANEPPPPVVATVVEDPVACEPPLRDNPAHALIKGHDRSPPGEPRKLTKGMANRLLRASTILAVD